MDFAEKVASNMKKGLSNELRKICEIGRVLRDVEGLAKSQVNYFMSIDEDFLLSLAILVLCIVITKR